jgi:hypothetical protein
MKKLLGLPLAAALCACGATEIRPASAPSAEWSQLQVAVRAADAEDAARLQDELRRTRLFGAVQLAPGDGGKADLLVTRLDQQLIGDPQGAFCFKYAASYLSAGLIPAVCDQRYRVNIELSAPASGRSEQLQVELTQRRVMGLYGAISSMFGDWQFWADTPGLNPPLTRAALLDQRPAIDRLLAAKAP